MDSIRPKLTLFTLLASTFCFGLSYELPWNVLTTYAGLPVGQQMQVPVPAKMIPVNIGWGRIRYEWRAPNISEFIIRVQQSKEECRPVGHTRDALVFTGVVSPVRPDTPTTLSDTHESPTQPRWTNYVFTVNGGLGLPAQAITPVFARTRFAGLCRFDVLYREGSRGVVYPLDAKEGDSPVGRDGDDDKKKEKQQALDLKSQQVVQQGQVLIHIQQKAKGDRTAEEQKLLEQGIQVQTR